MTPQETVERALAAARCDGCIVIADEASQRAAPRARSTASWGVMPPPRPC